MSLLSDLLAVAGNYAWSWNNKWRDLLEQAVGPDWGGHVHPVRALRALSPDALVALESDDRLVATARGAAAAVRALEDDARAGDRPDVAYFSPEFGVSESLPQYSGGLGILAGDHLKAASDLDLSLVAVGLFYTHGYFRQDVHHGAQTASYDTYEPESLGLVDTGAVVSVSTPRGDVAARVWLAHIGRIRLYLLDARVEGNPEWAAAITDRLYGGDQHHRIDQEWLLGIGGYRALEAVGVLPSMVHLNEGHAGFSLLELLARRLAAGDSPVEARRWVIDRTLFTTHTPVPAGIDRFPDRLLMPYLMCWAEESGGDAGDIWALGQMPSDHAPHEFNMAAFCLRNAAMANGVSALHGSVSRRLFSSLDQGSSITSVTNGVHARTWTVPSIARRLDHALGSGWADGETEAWNRVDQLDTGSIVELRAEGRRRLVEGLAARGFDGLDPEALTIGFARRFATYKRSALLLREQARVEALLADTDRPVQFVFAGKAHPADGPGQAVLAQVVAFGHTEAARGRFVFVPGYDMAIASLLYGGCDVWLNNPVRPQEACGTSGEKSALNGGINCSILDGWWAEWYHEDNGWAIPNSDADDPEVRDRFEADGLLALLEDEIVPTFYADGEHRPSEAWVERIRAGWRHLGPRVTAGRMVADYDRQLYQPIVSALS